MLKHFQLINLLKMYFLIKKFYYTTKVPFGRTGDFLTAPGISNLFSEIIGIWLISTWNTLGKPKNLI